MKHKTSADDRQFRRAFEAFEVSPESFGHRAHLRLAYVYLCDRPPAEAKTAMKTALLGFLDHLELGTSKFHETITAAWIDAVHHFMMTSAPAGSFDGFIAENPVLLDSKVMLTHYSAELLFSNRAREQVVDPDISDIPKHE